MKIMNEVVLSKKQLDYISKQVALYITGTMSAKQWGIKPDTLRKKAREGKIDAVKQGETGQSRLMFSIEAKIM